MKLVIQIPCYNEQATLPDTLADLPTEVAGFDEVEWLIIDDGSTDRTIDVAIEHGVTHVVRHRRNRGLAAAFRSGIEASLRVGADVIVNTDGDNQYCGADIEKLVLPIVEGEADFVIGDRQTWQLQHFSLVKRVLQRIGTRVVQILSATDVADAVSGFRAISRETALKINIFSTFSYTIETVIQAGRNQTAIASVPIRVNPKMRESRLFKSIPQFLSRSLKTMGRVYTMYQPLRVYSTLSAILISLGGFPILRFLWYYYTGDGQGHVQSLVLGGVLVVMGYLTFMIGVVADLTSINRRMLEMTLEKLRRIEHTRLSDEDT